MKSFRRSLTVDIRRLRVLRELKMRTTVGATARALNLTPSAISQQIAALSRDVGAPLLMPLGRGVRLTPQAELLLEHATLVDAQLERARADLAAMEQGKIGRLAVGAFATAISGLVAPALKRLGRECPGIQLSIQEIEAREVFTSLNRGDLDLIITIEHDAGPVHGDSRYYRQELLEDALLIALPRKHPLARRASIALSALAQERWIIGAVNGLCHKTGLAACAAAGFNPDIAHRVNDWSALLRLVAAGCGVALIPQLAINARDTSEVVLRAPAGRWRPGRHVYAAVRAGSERSPVIAAALAALGEVARG
jgi:DNA-binding transcriptional LysR family regulator